MTDLAARSVGQLSELIETGELSPVELTEAVLDNVSRHDDTLKAYIEVYRDDAMTAARNAETEIASGHYRGPLHGIPMGIKDNIYFADRVTTMGSKIHGDFVSETNATVVDRLSDAGVVFLGKLNMHEYALGGTTDNQFHGTCRNPWDLTMSPGGSSGGSGAALASNMTIAALGTDTSGSIRIPAALCGIVGLKPTYGRVSRFGCFPEAWTLDHIGPMTRTVADAAIVLDAISGYDARDPGSLNQPPTRTAGQLASTLDGVVIGIDEEFFFTDVDDEIDRCVRDGIEALRRQGATIKSISIPGLSNCEWALTIIDTSETSTVHHANLRDRPEDYSDDVRLLLECGELPSAVEYLEAQQLRRHLRSEMQRAFDGVDVLVAPTLPTRTPLIGKTTTTINGRDVDAIESLMRLVGPASLLGLPSLSVPCGVAKGLPVGMQVIGPALGEQKVLNTGHVLELSEPMGSMRATAYLDGTIPG
ncbi:MAG: aspartyl-tRNA(Asn)/glutamyl-tRNA(Gln) amidotransferase subunit [Kribbellaceae bacterium]|jgi:aspartyl-tRNA(Asn)/glutamyl-tRNA(Gln) amidotransferase subunit A|nr:aspartyl-tRNA(Asn)/glutamyl-tRNA(Gln) amidotransferase subunit [Kribbellaceae bacterium]